MDFGTTLKHLAPFAVPLMALLIPIIAIIMNGLVRIKRNRYLHETIRLMTEKGLPIPPELTARKIPLTCRRVVIDSNRFACCRLRLTW